MKKLFLILFSATFCTVNAESPEVAWGFYAHSYINRMAVFTLPEGMFDFYKKHIEFLTDHAVDPDKRRYAVEGEAPHHYIDIDHYADEGENPFELVPRNWYDAVELFTEDTLNAYGTVPWHINNVLSWLTEAFREMDRDRILQLSADIGHYIGDAHVPLHTTENYNGQLTDQKGIHGFWESRIPELYADDYDYLVNKAEVLESPLDAAWDAVEASHAAVDSVLLFEAALNEEFPSDQKYAYEQRGSTTTQVYSQEYTNAYDELLDGMVERRMRESIIAIGSFWYTAWFNAGKPDLSLLDDKEFNEELQRQWKEEEQMWNTGKIHGREHE